MKLWIEILWAAMQKTGNGYHRHSLKHAGKGLDRRNDKLRETEVIEDGKLKTVFVARHERKLERAARLGML